jgi:hypothetical protein
MDGNKFQRTPFHEEFAGDDYLKWPEREQRVSAGEYTIIVSNKDNQGKYSLAIGKIESFPANEILKTFISLPQLKTQFFNKHRWAVSEGIIWQGMTRSIGILLFIFFLILFIKRMKK